MADPSIRRQQAMLGQRLLAAVLGGLLAIGLPTVASSADEIRCDQQPAPDWQDNTASANVTWDTLKPLVPVPNLYAWEEATVTVSDAVNVNREIYEERKCNWFGINCWYEKRVRNNPVTAAQLPFTYSLAPAGKAFDARTPQDRKDVGTVVDDPVSGDYRAYWADMGVTGSRVPRGGIGFGNGGINRTSCDGEPRVCSVGAYTVKLKVDSGPRAFRMVSALSARRFSYDELESPDILNANLRRSGANVQACVAKALFGQATTFHGPGSGSSASERQKILLLALRLNPTDTSIKTALGSTYLETGQFEDARKQTTSAISDLEKKRTAGAANAADYDNLDVSYATLAETSWSETAGNSAGAATEAAGALRLSIERLAERLKNFPLGDGAVAARGRLVDNSIRLAQVLARLGTAHDMAEAVSVIAQARDELPRRLSGAVPLESDAVGGTVAFTRADVPLFSDRAWKLDVSTLAVADDRSLTPFGTDPSGASSGGAPPRIAVYRWGGAGSHVQGLQRLLSSGRSPNLVPGRDVCVHQAAVLGDGALAAVSGKDADGEVANRLIAPPGEGVEVAGLLGAIAVARADGGDRTATLSWLDGDGAADGRGWHLEDYRTDLTDPRRLGIVKGAEEDVPILRAAPGGQLYAVGLRSSKDRSTNWTLLDAADKTRTATITCVGADNAASRIDDVAFVGSAAAPEGISIVGVGPGCVAPFAKADAGAPIVLRMDSADVGRREAVKALTGRATAFAWVAKAGDPIAISSWEPDSKGRPVAGTQKLHVLRWTFTVAEQSSTRNALYQADVAAWAAPVEAPVCEGAARGGFGTSERFRITGLAIASDSPQAVERPVVRAVVAGINGAVALRGAQSVDESTPAAAPGGAGPSVVTIASRSGSTERRPSRTGRFVASAVCNAGNYRDFQVGETTRVYALRRSDLAVIRLGREAREKCEGSSLAGSTEDAVRRVYAPPSSDSPLQVLDLKAGDEVVRLILATLPADAEKRSGPLPEAEVPTTCGLEGAIRPGTCDAAALVSALNGGRTARVGALVRDTTTDPGLDGQVPVRSEMRESVGRATHLTFAEAPVDGSRTVAVVSFPLVKDAAVRTFQVPEDAKPEALLEGDGTPLLVTRVPGSGKLVAVDMSGSERGEVEVGEDFFDLDRSRRLVARGRMVLVAQGAAGAPARIKVLAVKDGRLVAPACPDCTLQTDKGILALQKPLQTGPWLNPEGRLERFLADRELRDLISAKLDDDLGWKGWTAVSLDGVAGRELVSAGAGAPILLDGRDAMIVPQIGIVELWGTKP